MSENKLLVSKITDGIVIDHIPAGKAFLVIKLLNLEPDTRSLIAQNVESRRMGLKDLIKIEGTYLTSKALNTIALVAPSATLNTIQNKDIKEKRHIELPEMIEGIFTCPSLVCPTNKEYSAIKPSFTVKQGTKLEELKLQCKYCRSMIYYGSIVDTFNSDTFSPMGKGLVSRKKIERIFLDVLLRGGALRFSPAPDQPFMLKSGRPSPYFVNLGALTDGESLAKLKWTFASYIALLMEQGHISDFDYVFGPSYKGISLAALTCEGLNELYGMYRRYMYDRKETKNYGDVTADRVLVGAGYFKPGQRILVVDDTITTGSTKVESIEKLRMLGDHEIVGMVIAVDRQEKMGDRDNIAEMSAVDYLVNELGIRVFSIENIKIIYNLIEGTLDDQMRRLWQDYYSTYGTIKLA